MHLFTNSVEGVFVERPNRFVVRVLTTDGIIPAHCPNSGRLAEILVPQRRLILEDNRRQGRKTDYSVVAAYYKNNIIPLVSRQANLVAKELILPSRFPHADIITAEPTHGNSRFDFLIRKDAHTTYLEVKACTLSEYGVAMFPDAPTQRGLRHLQELSGLRSKNREGMILFVIMHPDTEYFMPNIHTDPHFSAALQAASSTVHIAAASVEATATGEVRLKQRDIPVSFSVLRFLEENRGVYALVIYLRAPAEITVGKAGTFRFPHGYYVYIGSAKMNLSQRIQRHLRKTKKLHWHIDYLLHIADKVTPLPIYSGEDDLECRLAHTISPIADDAVNGFGCSDCTCASHLFFFRHNPLSEEQFIQRILAYRHRNMILS
jgi:sugar fermentation stimulation protein A